MKKLWYVSGASASTAAAKLGMHDSERLTSNVAVALLAATFGCAGPGGFKPTSGSEAASTKAAPAEKPGARDANLAGGRCGRGPGEPCVCRDRRGNPAENPAPDAAHKRFEIRLSAEGGSATLDSPTLGHFAARDAETCFYADVLPGTISDVTFMAKEGFVGQGMGPTLEIAEYGPKGPWWYRILDLRCDAGPGGKCNREALDALKEDVEKHKRNRIDPCGSAAVTNIHWDTSGGTGDPELGLHRDLTFTFKLEVKRFATQFAPGSTECVPK